MYNLLQYYYLQQMGIQVWLKRANTTPEVSQEVDTISNVANTSPSYPLMMIVPSFEYPLAGKAKILLKKMLSSVGFGENIYVTNLDHVPSSKQISDHMVKQIADVNPQVILALGGEAGQLFYDKSLTLNDMRNKPDHYQGKPVLVSFDPEHLLRHPADKKKAFSDLIEAKRLIHASSM